MRFWFGATTVLLAATFAGAGNEELEALARDVLKTGKEFTTTLGTIKDKQTAEAAKARLVSVFKRLQGLEQKRNGLSPAQQKILQEKHGKELAATISLEIVLKESARLKKLPGVLEVFRGTQLLWDFFGVSRGAAVRADLITLTRAVEAYKVQHREFPESLAVLTKAKKGQQPYLEATSLLDPWDRPYVYERDALDPTTGRPLIYSQGTNPADPASRIRNWDPPKKP